MSTFLLIATIVLWLVVLILGFLLLGALRALGLVTWRLDQMELARPSRLGRDGLKLGKKAPDFTLPSATNGELALHDFLGRKVLLVFTQSGCGPCKTIVPELNRVHDQGQCQVLVVNNGDPETTRQWAAETNAHFPVLAQEKLSISKRYEVFATPFAFLIDDKGIIRSRGIVGNRQYLTFVLTGASNRAKAYHDESEADASEKAESENQHSSTEVTHV